MALYQPRVIRPPKLNESFFGFRNFYKIVGIHIRFFASREVRMGKKLCPRNTALNTALGLWPQAVLKTKSKVFLNTERPRLLGNIIIFFLLGFREMLWGCNCGKILHKLNNFWASKRKLNQVMQIKERVFTEKILYV